MKYIKKTKTKLIILALLLLIGGVVYYFVAVRGADDNNVAKQKGAENVAQTTKENAANQKAGGKDGSSGNSNAEQPQSNSQLQGATLSITNFEQSGGMVRASATINKSSSGTCYYGFSSSDTKPVSRTNQSQDQGGSQLCKVEIPEVEFTKLGVWKMLLSFTQNGAKVEASQDVTIN